ncbi:MAG: TetR/AcrR family transcriptional regulator, partial [Pseudomonadota bacterium]
MTSFSAATASRDAASKSKETPDLLIEAGIKLFSEQGYDATSTRQIETSARVQRSLIAYHFGNKKNFWKACMTRLYESRYDLAGLEIPQAVADDPREKLKFIIRHYVRANAEVPELARIMCDEGRRQDWRIKWLVKKFSVEFYDTIKQLYERGRKDNVVPDIPLTHFYYNMVSSAL